MSEYVNNWRLRKQRLRLIGEVHSCGTKIFPPRDVCPECAAKQQAAFLENSTAQVTPALDLNRRTVELDVSVVTAQPLAGAIIKYLEIVVAFADSVPVLRRILPHFQASRSESA